jgi:hypothetical protein
MTYTATVSGKTYYLALDSDASAFAEEHKLPEPEFSRVGRGHRVTYRDLTKDQYEDLLWHLETLADTWSGGGIDEDGARDARTLRRDIERNRKGS